MDGCPPSPCRIPRDEGAPDEPPSLLRRTVAPGEDGTRADVLLAGWLDEPRSRVQERLGAGDVRIDGQPAAKSRRVRAGEAVTVAAPVPPPAPAPPRLVVRWEDGHLLVVAKPAGLVVHPGAGTARGPTLVDSLRAAGATLAPAGGLDRPGIVHRLDRGTSGLLVVAKTDAAHRRLARRFAAHDVDRRYWALVDGVPHPPAATIDAPLSRSTARRTRFTVAAHGRRAVTHYDVEEAHGRAAVITARLETGRTHQVRVHLSAVGHPVSGDAVYGASAVLAADLGLQRPALHARRLAFDHPLTGERIALEEPLPADLEAARHRLRAG